MLSPLTRNATSLIKGLAPFRTFLFSKLIAAFALVVVVILDPGSILIALLGLPLLVLMTAYGDCSQWKLLFLSMSCRSMYGKRVSIHFPPELLARVEQTSALDWCDREFIDIEKWFGSGRRHRVSIYLFEGNHEIERISGILHCRGYALTDVGAVLVTLEDDFHSTLRHELAHVLSATIGRGRPLFKSEGLAVWFECGCRGPILDRSILNSELPNSLSNLLKHRGFGPPNAQFESSLIAASFTDFLIVRFGWHAYLRFYRAAGGFGFHRAFERVFGLSFIEAESLWRITIE